MQTKINDRFADLGFYRVAAATLPVQVGDVDHNTAAVLQKLRQAAEAGVDVLVCPELCLTGYTCGDLFLQQPLQAAAVTALVQLTLATADRERNLAQLTAQSAAAYYEADQQAVEIVAALRKGEEPPGDVLVDRMVSTTPEGSTESVSFTVPVTDELGLEVEVLIHDADGSLEVLRWQTVYTGGWETDDTLELWSGDIY